MKIPYFFTTLYILDIIYIIRICFTITGYFTYIEASRPRKNGDRATLESPIVRATHGCLTFWYHMRGSGIGRLRLHLSTAVASNVLFERNGEKGRDWLLAKIDVDPSWGTSSGYKVSFRCSVVPFFHALLERFFI